MKRLSAFLLVLILCLGLGATVSADLNVVKTVTVSNSANLITVEEVTVDSYFNNWTVANVSAPGVTISVPDTCYLISVTVNTAYPDRWPFVSDGSVTYLDSYAMRIDFPAEKQVRSVEIFGILYDQGQPANNQYGLSDHISSITVEYIGPHPHVKDESAYHAAVASTCTQTGTVEYWECTNPDCDVKLNAAGEVIEDLTAPLDPDAHDFGPFSPVNPVKCTEATLESAACTRCGETISIMLPATGHHYGEYSVARAPTCTGTGTEIATCANCGDTVARSIPATGHSYGKYVVTTAPTCTKSGIETATCTVCGDTVTRSVPATGHSCKFTVTKEASCVAAGEKTGTCSVCGETVTEKIPVDPNAHSCSKYDKVVKKPTCATPGVEKGKCTLCGGDATRPTPVDPDAHNWLPLNNNSLQCEYCHRVKSSLFGSTFSEGSGVIIAAAAAVVIAAAAVLIVRKKKKDKQ